jgi:hypothetical protein
MSPASGSIGADPVAGSSDIVSGCAIATGMGAGCTASGDTAAATGSSARTRKPAVVVTLLMPRMFTFTPFRLPLACGSVVLSDVQAMCHANFACFSGALPIVAARKDRHVPLRDK